MFKCLSLSLENKAWVLFITASLALTGSVNASWVNQWVAKPQPSSQRKVEALLSLKSLWSQLWDEENLTHLNWLSGPQRILRSPGYIIVSEECVAFVFEAGLKDLGCHGNSWAGLFSPILHLGSLGCHNNYWSTPLLPNLPRDLQLPCGGATFLGTEVTLMSGNPCTLGPLSKSPSEEIWKGVAQEVAWPRWRVEGQGKARARVLLFPSPVGSPLSGD